MVSAASRALLVLAVFAGGALTRSPKSPSLPRGNVSHTSVTIAGGRVHGMIDHSMPNVRQFLGIPYAQPPVGKLRFAAPQPALPFGDLDATHMPPSCPQFLMKTPQNVYTEHVLEFNLQGANATSHEISEDCLTISVWTPTSTSNVIHETRHLPVLIFIYGGAFLTGSVDVPYQVPAQWVQRTQAHVVAVFNYRLNIYGFPHAAGLPEGQENAGLRDQRLAVEWVRDNIAAFGGDPARITLWGQSAGAIGAGYYQYAYAHDPIINAVIMNSGTELLPGATSSSADAKGLTFSTVAAQFGCGNLSATAELDCMRGANISALNVEGFIETHNDASILDFLEGKPSTVFFFTPVVDNLTVFPDYTARARAGEIAKIPTILGTNKEDGVPFVPLDADGGGVNETLAMWATLGSFFCPGFKAATNRIAAGVPVYRYLYAGNFSNISPAPFLGAYHAAELPMIFGTENNYRGPPTDLELATSHAMQDAWLAFASTGVPADGWPRYTDPVTGLAREYGVASSAPLGYVDISLHPEEAQLCPEMYQPDAP
ncbi:Alpha/Beta hydrolase protein [Lasiosphaeria miniovina]|uniref:Carboxylic ester hydrolase n=1 Tax=Lasiosphaeria miniovina TaxID=1954250 RepID=A0AA40DJ89_9PEZI|nr:Alpha/Beta hydrolase protein [Lasiosphaeria miniovina]KAK0701943.1 Alpha/Beta hydrolase protein [Lasiosphaeria miniovina]